MEKKTKMPPIVEQYTDEQLQKKAQLQKTLAQYEKTLTTFASRYKKELIRTMRQTLEAELNAEIGKRRLNDDTSGRKSKRKNKSVTPIVSGEDDGEKSIVRDPTSGGGGSVGSSKQKKTIMSSSASIATVPADSDDTKPSAKTRERLKRATERHKKQDAEQLAESGCSIM